MLSNRQQGIKFLCKDNVLTNQLTNVARVESMMPIISGDVSWLSFNSPACMKKAWSMHNLQVSNPKYNSVYRTISQHDKVKLD